MTAAAAECAGPDWLAGRALIEDHARAGRVFTSNELRPLLRAYGFGRFDSGQLFRQAHDDGLIRRVGVDVSTDKPSHGAFVRRWVGAQVGALETLIPTRGEAVVVPVQRDREGRFATQPAFTDVPLFEVDR